MNKRLEKYNSDDRKQRSAIKAQVLEMQFGDDEATKRVVMHSAKRIIQQHKAELQALAYK